MTIIRTAKSHFRHAIINHEAILNQNLSLDAIGLLVYLLHHVDEQQFHLSQIASNRKEDESVIILAIDELEKNGYALRLQQKNENGDFTHCEIIVSDDKDEISLIKKELFQNTMIKDILA